MKVTKIRFVINKNHIKIYYWDPEYKSGWWRLCGRVWTKKGSEDAVPVLPG